jgi:hypothetical protein
MSAASVALDPLARSTTKVLHLGDQAFCEFDVFSEMLVTHLDNRNPDLCQTFPPPVANDLPQLHP